MRTTICLVALLFVGCEARQPVADAVTATIEWGGPDSPEWREYIRAFKPIHIVRGPVPCLVETMERNHRYWYVYDGHWREAIRFDADWTDQLTCTEYALD